MVYYNMSYAKKQLEYLTKEPLPNLSVEAVDETKEWNATLLGPPGSVYEGGVFKLHITFPGSYPFTPPKIKFVTSIYHPNINQDGYIHLDILKEMWSPALQLRNVFIAISQLLIEPNVADPLMPEIAFQYKSNIALFESTAREWTKKHASST